MKKSILLLFVCFLFLQACSDPKYNFSSMESFEASLYAQGEKEGLTKVEIDNAMIVFCANLEKEFIELDNDFSGQLNELMAKELDLNYDLDNASSEAESDKLKKELLELNEKRNATLTKFKELSEAKLLLLCDDKFANRELKAIFNL